MKQILYQPVPNEAINNNSVVIRNSADRLRAMANFSVQYFGTDLDKKTFLDIGCALGYFMNGMNKFCKSVTGIERNRSAIMNAQIFYSDISDHIIQGNIDDEVYGLEEYDIVAFLSVFHMIMSANSENAALNVLKTIDSKTKDIMFFEMGQEHEQQYANSLEGWNPEKIQDYVLSNTSFKFCKPLIVDSDSVGDFEGSFGRTLFAFYRKEI